MTIASINMFGVEDMKDFVESVEKSFSFKRGDMGMILMSILSDAQAEMALGDQDRARKSLNRVKFLINRYEVTTKVVDDEI